MGAFTDYHVRRGGPESVSVAGGTKRNSKANAERQRTLRLAVKRKHETRALRSEQGGCEDVSFRKLRRESSLYVNFAATYTPYEAQVRRLPDFLLRRLVCGLIFSCAFGALPARCQEPAPSAVKPAQKSAEASEKAPELPAQIELLETRVRFEANGDSHKEVHTRVHINNELGVRQFARLAFDYNRSFESIEIPLVHITHPSGGTADILPSAITDNPNPAVVKAPAYQDVRVKSVRILGLEPGDNLEYRVITTTTHHPLAPDFWLDHSFDRSGIVSHEIFELDLPADHVQPRINLATPATAIDRSDAARTIYRWERNSPHSPKESPSFGKESAESEPDIVLSTTQWEVLSIRLDERLTFAANPLDRIEIGRAS